MMLLCGFLRVCPNQFHLRVLIVLSTGCCLVFLHKSVLLFFSGHLIPRMILRHLFTKTWTDFIAVDVSLQISDPYRITDFTLVLNNLSLVLVLNALLLHTGLKMAKAWCAFLFLALTSSSMRLDVLTILPR